MGAGWVGGGQVGWGGLDVRRTRDGKDNVGKALWVCVFWLVSDVQGCCSTTVDSLNAVLSASECRPGSMRSWLVSLGLCLVCGLAQRCRGQLQHVAVSFRAPAFFNAVLACVCAQRRRWCGRHADRSPRSRFYFRCSTSSLVSDVCHKPSF